MSVEVVYGIKVEGGKIFVTPYKSMRDVPSDETSKRADEYMDYVESLTKNKER